MNDKRKLLVTFILGAVAGALVAWPSTHCFMRWKSSGEGRGARHHKRMLREFNRKLDLTEDQKKQIELVLDGKRKKIEELREQTRPKFKELRESTKNEIRALLRPDQFDKFDKLAEEHEKRWEQKR